MLLIKTAFAILLLQTIATADPCSFVETGSKTIYQFSTSLTSWWSLYTNTSLSTSTIFETFITTPGTCSPKFTSTPTSTPTQMPTLTQAHSSTLRTTTMADATLTAEAPLASPACAFHATIYKNCEENPIVQISILNVRHYADGKISKTVDKKQFFPREKRDGGEPIDIGLHCKLEVGWTSAVSAVSYTYCSRTFTSLLMAPWQPNESFQSGTCAPKEWSGECGAGTEWIVSRVFRSLESILTSA
jgi:hypothetical protein